tara:strand:- start:752 stop:1000 length:249 start_codon:yes stop_codon:yes gene_type:complete
VAKDNSKPQTQETLRATNSPLSTVKIITSLARSARIMKFTTTFTLLSAAASLVAGNPFTTEVNLEKRASCVAFHAGKFFGGT